MTSEVIPAGEVCANCQAPLSGAYCAQCGQRYEAHPHSVAEFTHEAIEGVTHADSRFWQTLWLLIARPGVLTREFIEGRRVRYLPPFRLYLVLSVLLFLVITIIVPLGSDQPETAETSPAAANQNDQTAAPANETPEQRVARMCQGGGLGMVSGETEKELLSNCRKIAVDNGHAFGQALLHNVPRALFVLIPLLALVMKAMYWRRYYVEHLLFFIHNHAFTFVLYTVVIVAMKISPWGWLSTLLGITLIVYPAIYTYKAMRLVYGQEPWVRRLKFTALTIAYGVLLLVIAGFTALYSMVTL